jgi:hypothetical protein
MSNFTSVVESMIETRLGELHTCLPGKVVKVDVAKAQCDVQPLLKRTYANGDIVSMPVITNVPIAFYRAGKAFISLPVHVGDYVELRFAERSLDVWLEKGGEVDPADFRKFDLSDAIAYPGLYPNSDPPAGADPESIIIKNDQSVVTIKPSGEVEIKGDNAIKLLSNLITLSGDGDAIALASKVLTELQNIHTWATTHTHGGVTSGSATSGPSLTPKQPPQTVASTKVKAV